MFSSTVLRGGELSSCLCVRIAFWRGTKDSVLHFAQILSLLATKGPIPGLTIVAAALSLACWLCCLPRAVLSIENHPSLFPCVLLVPLLWGLALRCGCAGGQGWNKGLSFWLQALAPQAWRRNSLLIVPHREGLAYYFLKGVGKAMCPVKNHRQKWKPLSLVTTWCDGNRRSLKAEQEPSALSPFFPWSCIPTQRRGEGWWSCRPRALAALWIPKLRAVGKGRPQNRKMLGVESLGADPSFTGGLGRGTWRSRPPENWDKSLGDEDSGAGNGNVWWAPDQGPASSAAAPQRLHICVWCSCIALLCACWLKPLQTAMVRPVNSHYSGLSPATRLLSNPGLFLMLSYSGLYPESCSLIQKILNFRLIFYIVLCVFYRIQSFLWERWPFFVSYHQNNTSFFLSFC